MLEFVVALTKYVLMQLFIPVSLDSVILMGGGPCKDFYVHKVCALASQDLQHPYNVLPLFNTLLDAMTHIDCLILCHTEQDFSGTSFTWTKTKNVLCSV